MMVGIRVKDWLHGVRAAAPDKETQRSLDGEPLTEAERLRIVWQLIILPESEGGAGITPKQGEWKLVESIFPLHDREFNKVHILHSRLSALLLRNEYWS